MPYAKQVDDAILAVFTNERELTYAQIEKALPKIETGALIESLMSLCRSGKVAFRKIPPDMYAFKLK